MSKFKDTIGDHFDNQVAQHPDKEFIIYSDRDLRFTYAQFQERVNNLANGLLEIGLKPGDHLGIWATNVPDWLTFFFATAKIGVVAVTINTLYKSHELSYVLKQSDMHTLAIIDSYRDTDYVNTIYELIPELKTRQRGFIKSKFPKLVNVIFIGPEKHRGMFSTSELLELGRHGRDKKRKQIQSSLDCHDVINMQYTSGTTGFPKGVMLSHFNILNNGYFIGEQQNFTSDDRLLLPVPLFHCFGLVLGVLAVLTHGASMVILEQFDPLRVLAFIQKEKCTAVYGVPTMFISELRHPMFEMFDLSSLRTGIMAGSPCPKEIMKQVMEKLHCKEITIAYGLTEASPVITQTSPYDDIERRVSTVGRVLPDIEVKIIDPESGNPLGPNQQGELMCRGYNVMKGYYNMPDATRNAIEKDGWLHSGDLAAVDEQGYYKITGRIKDMIIRGGENIYPRELEEFLYTMPEIKDVQVVGVADEKFGEQVAAFIKLDVPGAVAEQDVKDFCRGKIARFKIPTYVFFVADYPMTASGKVQKYKLSEMALELLKDRS